MVDTSREQLGGVAKTEWGERFPKSHALWVWVCVEIH